MVDRLLLGAMVILLLCRAQPAGGQDIDSNVTTRNRTQAGIADQIRDPAERAAFVALYSKLDAPKMLIGAEDFLTKYPESAFLAQVYENAARGCFDTGEYARGLEYARKSLVLLPENPLLLVAAADVEAGQSLNDDAIRNATDGLRYLDEFARPVSVAESDWPRVKRQQQAIAHFAIGRAKLQKALKQGTSPAKRELLNASVASLSEARMLSPDDQEAAYLLGIAYQSSGDLSRAASSFATVYSRGGDFAPRALASLQEIYKAHLSDPTTSFEAFLAKAGHTNEPATASLTPEAAHAGGKLPGYAGSNACKDCHAEIYENWSQTGMAKMFRPYQAANVIGDFTKNNEFYTGDDVQYLHGKLNTLPGEDRKLFARMVVRAGKHYFDIHQSDGRWQSYPVDYTIGSKWQQAYATKLPNGQIHVFPIQYSVLEKKWLNYWKSLDGAGSERSDPYNFSRLDSATNYQEKCAVCHTSQLRNVNGGGLEGDGLQFREPGIGCEMCHGPSAGHIAGMVNGESYAKKAAIDPPVNFERISSREFVSICAQCHMQATIRDPGPHGELNYSTADRFFKESASVPFGEFTRKGFYKDGRFSQTTFIVEALERTKCFRLGQANCGTCHYPHGHGFSTNQTSLRFKNEPDKMCVGCHSQFQDKLKAAAHTHHGSESEGSRCVSCHMPKITDALTFSARTHQIDDIPNAKMTLRFGQSESPNACLMCHKEKSAQWVQGQLASWNAPDATALRTAASWTTR